MYILEHFLSLFHERFADVIRAVRHWRFNIKANEEKTQKKLFAAKHIQDVHGLYNISLDETCSEMLF